MGHVHFPQDCGAAAGGGDSWCVPDGNVRVLQRASDGAVLLELPASRQVLLVRDELPPYGRALVPAADDVDRYVYQLTGGADKKHAACGLKSSSHGVGYPKSSSSTVFYFRSSSVLRGLMKNVFHQRSHLEDSEQGARADTAIGMGLGFH